jgi:hypothetical protein
MEVIFRNKPHKVRKEKYAETKNICLVLIEKDTNQWAAVATINMADRVNLQPDEVIIKDYSENKGMLKALIDGKIIAIPDRQFELNQFGTLAYISKCLI